MCDKDPIKLNSRSFNGRNLLGWGGGILISHHYKKFSVDGGIVLRARTLRP